MYGLRKLPGHKREYLSTTWETSRTPPPQNNTLLGYTRFVPVQGALPHSQLQLKKQKTGFLHVQENRRPRLDVNTYLSMIHGCSQTEGVECSGVEGLMSMYFTAHVGFHILDVQHRNARHPGSRRSTCRRHGGAHVWVGGHGWHGWHGWHGGVSCSNGLNFRGISNSLLHSDVLIMVISGSWQSWQCTSTSWNGRMTGTHHEFLHFVPLPTKYLRFSIFTLQPRRKVASRTCLFFSFLFSSIIFLCFYSSSLLPHLSRRAAGPTQSRTDYNQGINLQNDEHPNVITYMAWRHAIVLL